MGAFSIWHWLVVLAVVLLLFGGRGKVSAIMGDFGKGLRNFKTGLKGEEERLPLTKQRLRSSKRLLGSSKEGRSKKEGCC